MTLLVFLENWGSVFLNKPRKTIKEKNKNQQLKFFKKRKKKSVREWRNDRVTWEWSGEPDVESWCLATGFSSSMEFREDWISKMENLWVFFGDWGVRNLNSWKWETERKRGWTRGKVSVPVWASRESIVEWIKFWVFF